MITETYETVWNEDVQCPKCGCRVLKECYSTVLTNDREYSHDVIIIQCPNCDYDVTEPQE